MSANTKQQKERDKAIPHLLDYINSNDAGRARVFSAQVVTQILALYQENPFWSVQLHHDNLRACSTLEPSLGKLPSLFIVKALLAC